ncbi:hypothetical protein [Chitinophaga nivalis]|uniref:SH3b domain-containing protein n=1 Tax=Chitinophaga nivalis TaxID=2991709 RepID=A0ABT3IQA8_9BACT|nr:hypothetical protein [Chitinophaga nivalis]MCW3464145.1 hypothetical protein [Chitinophaga nivalis]MCW3486165.1 hypothetical protein [Chitinophaga nivalis]
MKRFSFFLYLVLSGAATSYAQTRASTWNLQPGESRYIFTDTAYVRTGPDTRQTIADTLFAGDEIIVREILEKPLALKGFTAPWLQISYKKDSVEKNGFLWQGLVSLTPLRRGDIRFIFGIDRRFTKTYQDNGVPYEASEILIRLKAVTGGTSIHSAEFRITDEETLNYTDGRIMSGLGLTNVRNIIVLTFSGAACGIPTNHYYFAWLQDNRLVRLPGRTDESDAGVYYHEERFVFPAEKGGQPDQIILNIEDASNEDEKVDKTGNPIYIIKKSQQRFGWNGGNGTFGPLP